MASTTLSYHFAVLPWTASAEDERRFRRILSIVLLLSLLFGLVLPLLPRPPADREAEAVLPQRFAKMLLEHPLPPPVIPKPEALPNPTESEVKAKAEKPKVEVKKPVPEARKPVPDKAPGEKLEAARKKASGVGLLAMQDELADLRGAPVAVQLNQNIKQGPGVGAGVGPGVGAGLEAGVPVRAMITSNATRGSGGINTAGYSRDTGGGGLAGRATTMVEGYAGGGGGGGAGGGAGGNGATRQGGTLQKGADSKASRSIEDIRLVMERNKAAIYAIYNRSLREDPSLAGKVVIQLKIAPSGEVLDCQIVSSEVHAPEFEHKLLARIKQFDFGAKDVSTMVLSYPLDFLPS
jgi:outer membrane biosynthesis protein TonB